MTVDKSTYGVVSGRIWSEGFDKKFWQKHRDSCCKKIPVEAELEAIKKVAGVKGEPQGLKLSQLREIKPLYEKAVTVMKKAQSQAKSKGKEWTAKFCGKYIEILGKYETARQKLEQELSAQGLAAEEAALAANEKKNAQQQQAAQEQPSEAEQKQIAALKKALDQALGLLKLGQRLKKKADSGAKAAKVISAKWAQMQKTNQDPQTVQDFLTKVQGISREFDFGDLADRAEKGLTQCANLARLYPKKPQSRELRKAIVDAQGVITPASKDLSHARRVAAPSGDQINDIVAEIQALRMGAVR